MSSMRGDHDVALRDGVRRLRRDIRGEPARPGSLPGLPGVDAAGAEALTGVAWLGRWWGRRYGRPHCSRSRSAV
jgi:hypothetical protein